MSMRTALVVLAALACGCAAAPMQRNEFAPTPERTVYLAARHVEASDAQRRAIMAAWDAHAVELRRLHAAALALQEQWQGLDRRSPDFAARSEQLARGWGDLGAEELQLRGRFEQEVAATLEPAQWERWRDFMREQELPEPEFRAARYRRGP